MDSAGGETAAFARSLWFVGDSIVPVRPGQRTSSRSCTNWNAVKSIHVSDSQCAFLSNPLQMLMRCRPHLVSVKSVAITLSPLEGESEEREYLLEVTKNKVVFGATMVPACGEISSRSNFNNGLCAAVIFCDIAKCRRQPGYGLRAPPNSIPRYDQPKGSMSADQIGRGWTDLQKFNVSASKQQFSFELSRRARIESPILEQVRLCWQQSASFLRSWPFFTDYRTRGLRRVQDGP